MDTPLIHGKNDIGILGLPVLPQLIQNAADLCIHVGDQSIVFTPVNFNGIFRLWKRRQTLSRKTSPHPIKSLYGYSSR